MSPKTDSPPLPRIEPIRIKLPRAWHLQAAIRSPVKTSFGTMNARTAIMVMIEDARGRRGWGESWVNFPAWASYERTKAFELEYLPYLAGKEVADIPAFIRQMYLAFRGTAMQAGAMGPLVQAICAIELALWDLAARAAGKPLRKLFCANPADSVALYGSGINQPLPWPRIDALLDCGVGVFKLKLGFGDDDDLRNLKELAAHLGSKARIAVDVNRGWDLPTARRWLSVLRDFDVQWLEEPLRPDQEHLMGELAAASPVPIAAGENTFFDPSAGDLAALARLPMRIFQPDVTKNCPLHQALALLPMALAGGKRLYPHFLGSAVGQAASLQLACCCGATLMEWDVNENPLRTDLMRRPFKIENGAIRLDDSPGIGYDLDDEAMGRFAVA